MEQNARAEIDKLHERITRLRERVANLEAQQPHMTAALLRIEKDTAEAFKRVEQKVAQLNGHISKFVWAVLVLFIGVVFKFTVDGGWTHIVPN